MERKGVRWSDDDRRTFDVTVTPLARPDGQRMGASISFVDVSRYHRLQEELEQSNRDLEAAYEELQSTNEELETTNEELQSTIEELETTNEELQSSNEELETTNEELQSTNDELHGVNDQLEHRGAELDRANLHLEGILTGLRLGIVVLDRQLTVQLWNHWAEDLWGLRAVEVSARSFLDLDIGLPVERLAGRSAGASTRRRARRSSYRPGTGAVRRSPAGSSSARWRSMAPSTASSSSWKRNYRSTTGNTRPVPPRGGGGSESPTGCAEGCGPPVVGSPCRVFWA